MIRVLEVYLAQYPEETARLAEIRRFLQITPPGHLFHRKNFDGHITASGFVLSPDRTKIAVVEHKFLKRFLQPGGHVEDSDATVLEAARREVREETGLVDCVLLPAYPDALRPFDIDSHQIPANPKKNEPGHFHHDFRYLFQAKTEIDPAQFTSAEEAHWAWQPYATAIDEPTYQFVINKLNRLSL